MPGELHFMVGFVGFSVQDWQVMYILLVMYACHLPETVIAGLALCVVFRTSSTGTSGSRDRSLLKVWNRLSRKSRFVHLVAVTVGLLLFGVVWCSQGLREK